MFVLKTGIGWDDLPAAPGYGCGNVRRSAVAAYHSAVRASDRLTDKEIEWLLTN